MSVVDSYRLFSSLTGRYAYSLFSVASAESLLDSVLVDIFSFEKVLAERADLKLFVNSPVFAVKEKHEIIDTLVRKAGFCEISSNFFKVLAINGRMPLVSQIIGSFHMICAYYRGEVVADVRASDVLSSDQQDELRASLKKVIGKDISLNIIVDPSLVGGFVVRIGSRQIDTSLRAKFSALRFILKEVG